MATVKDRIYKLSAMPPVTTVTGCPPEPCWPLRLMSNLGTMARTQRSRRSLTLAWPRKRDEKLQHETALGRWTRKASRLKLQLEGHLEMVGVVVQQILQNAFILLPRGFFNRHLNHFLTWKITCKSSSESDPDFDPP